MPYPFRLGLSLGLIFVAPLVLGASRGNFDLNPADLTVQHQPRAMPQAQRQHRQKQLDLIRPELYNLRTYPATAANETHWRKTLWATALLEPQAPHITQALDQILSLSEQSDLSDSQIRTVQMAMQIGTQFFLATAREPQAPNLLDQRLRKIVEISPYPEWVSMALSALVQGGLPPQQAQAYIQQIKTRFDPDKNLSLWVALKDIEAQLTPSSPPPLGDLLNWQIAPQQAHLYVFCRRDRSILCRAVLKDHRGKFVRDSSQPHRPLWSAQLLTRSLHGLRWNFTRGSTPQGIHRIEGTMPRSESAYFGAYGQFPLVKLFLPHEPGARAFASSQTPAFPSALQQYQTLLPPSWQNYFPAQESYWAGKLGRTLLRIHGSGEFPDFFANNSRFPQSYGWNPAIGCLSAKESYNADGTLREADMPKILEALSLANRGKIEGYLILGEIENGSQDAISLAEIEAHLPPQQ